MQASFTYFPTYKLPNDMKKWYHTSASIAQIMIRVTDSKKDWPENETTELKLRKKETTFTVGHIIGFLISFQYFNLIRIEIYLRNKALVLCCL